MLGALALQLAAVVGVAYIAGFSVVWQTVRSFRPFWLPGVLGCLGLSFVGYYFAYQGIYEVNDGPRLSPGRMRAVVAAGFGGFLAHSGAAVDHYALRTTGITERSARARVWALGGLEHGMLAAPALVAAVVLLLEGSKTPPLDVTLPWAVVPLPGFLLAFHLARRYKDRLRPAGRLRAGLVDLTRAIDLIGQMFADFGRYWSAPGGMVLFWVADGLAAWCALASFGYYMNGARFAVGLATGALFTRRTGPLAGAGVLTLVLPLSLWYCGADLAPALLGVFVFRLVSVWLPMPISFFYLRTLRSMGEEHLDRQKTDEACQDDSGQQAVVGIAAVDEAN